jgi:hypothetical protein
MPCLHDSNSRGGAQRITPILFFTFEECEATGPFYCATSQKIRP